MKKKSIKILLIALAVLVLYILFNQIDTKATPPEQYQATRPLTADDGFYLLCALAEPAGVDISNPQIVKTYDNLFAAKSKIENFNEHFKSQKEKNPLFSGGSEGEKESQAISWANDYRQNNCLHVLQYRETLQRMKEEKRVFIERYERMLASNTFNDLSTINHAGSTVVPLLNWLRMTKLYSFLQVLEALDGNWQPAVANLIQQINFVKRHNRSSRLLITNLIFKAVAKIPLWELAELMNQPNCPDEVYEQILQGLPDMTYEQFGTTSLETYEGLPGIRRHFQSGDFLKKLSWFEKILGKLIMQTNRTQRYFENYYLHLVRYEKTPPYQWEGDFKPENPQRGLLWWLQNPMGKIMYSNHLKREGSGGPAMILKSYSLLSTHDMVRISADLHIHYNADKSIEENLKGLKTYQTLLDPCSGKPYIFNQKKQILYGIGTDLDDDGGKGEPITSLDTDFVLPLRLKK